MRAKVLIVAAALLAAVVAPALAGTVVEMTQKNAAGEPGEPIRLSFDGQRLRMDMDVSSGKPGNSVVFRGDREEMMLLDHERREAMIMDRATLEKLATQLQQAMKQMEEAMANVPPAQREMMEQMMKGRMQGMMEAPAPIEVRKTSETGTTNGYKWTRYEVTRDGEKVQDLLVTDWSNLDADASDFEVFQEMAKFFQSLVDMMGDRMAGFAENPFTGADRIEGFPVVTRVYLNGKLSGETELTSVETADVPATLFENPGYKVQKMDVPKMR